MITATQKNIVLPPDRINFKNMDKKEFKETHKHLLEWNFGYLLQWHTHLLRIFTKNSIFYFRQVFSSNSSY